MEKIIVIHHNDMDGYAALAEVMMHYKHESNVEIVPYEFKYGTPLIDFIKGYDWNDVESLGIKKIYIVDCSVTESDVEYLNELARNIHPEFITLYDHHMESANLQPTMQFANIIDKERCGTMITYDQLNGGNSLRDIQNYVNSLDLFKFEEDPDVYFKATQMNTFLNAYGVERFVDAYINADTFEDFYENNKADMDKSNAEDEAIYNNVNNALYTDKFTFELEPDMIFNLYLMAPDTPKINLNVLRLKSPTYDETLFDQFINKDEENGNYRISTRINKTFECSKYIKDYVLAFPKKVFGGGHLLAFGCAIPIDALDEYRQYLCDMKNQEWCN